MKVLSLKNPGSPRKKVFTTADVGLARPFEYDFEMIGASTPTSLADASGNAHPLSIRNGTNFTIQATASGRKGLRMDSTITGYNTDKTYFKFLHDGTKSYTLYIEGRLDSASPNANCSLINNTGNTAANPGIALNLDDRDSQFRNNGLYFGIYKAGSPAIVENIVNCSVKPNGDFCICIIFNTAGTENLKMYANRSLQGVTQKSGTHSSANSTYDLEIGGNGNGGARWSGYLYRIVCFDGVISESKRLLLTASRANRLDSYPVDRRIVNVTNDTRYNAFGSILDFGDHAKIFFRSGTTHLLDGQEDYVRYDYTTKAVSRFTVGVPASNFDYRSGTAYRNGDTVVLLTGTFNETTGVSVELGRFVSTDKGVSWSAYQPISYLAGLDRGIMFGDIFTDENGVAYAVFYGRATSTNRVAYLLVSTDNFASFTWRRIYNELAAPFYTETSVAYCGGGKMVAIVRKDASTYGLYQCYSLDYGVTWSALVATNITGSTNVHVPYLLYDKNGLHLLYMDRNDGYIKASMGNSPDTVIASPTSWVPGVYYQLNNGGGTFLAVGYVMACRMNASDSYLLAWSDEASSTNANLYVREESFSGII